MLVIMSVQGNVESRLSFHHLEFHPILFLPIPQICPVPIPSYPSFRNQLVTYPGGEAPAQEDTQYRLRSMQRLLTSENDQ